jgi:ketosteroid isomerase-like protein
MRGSTLLLGSLLCVLVSACAEGAPAVDIAAETEALRATELAYHEAANALDADAVSAMYASGAEMYPPNEPSRSGINAIREFATAFTSAPGLQMDFELVDVAVAEGGAMGYTRSEGLVTVDGPDGEPVRQRLTDFHVWVKDGAGNWKLQIDIWNSPDPLPGG